MEKLLYLSFLLLIFLNCTIVALKGSGISQPVSLTNSIYGKEYMVIKPNAKWTKTVDLNQLGDFDIRPAILDLFAETPGDAIVNLKFKVRQTFFLGCIEMICLGLYSPYTVEVQGDIVKYK